MAEKKVKGDKAKDPKTAKLSLTSYITGNPVLSLVAARQEKKPKKPKKPS